MLLPMNAKRSEVLLHPIRLRIAFVVSGERLTTAEIAQKLPDVPQASLYRHIGRLADAGILDVVSERPARGSVEKTYSLNEAGATIGPDEVASMSNDEHLDAFTTFMGILVQNYGTYLNSPGAQPIADGVSYRQAQLWLDDDELIDLVSDVRAALTPYLELPKSSRRRKRLLNTILMPDASESS